jgi:hypothetical protein
MKWKIIVRWSTLHSYHSCVRGVSTGYWLDSWGWITGGGKMFLLSTTSIQVLGPTQAPIPWVPGAVSRGVKTFANYNYFYIIPYLISLIPSFLTESRARPGISASRGIFWYWTGRTDYNPKSLRRYSWRPDVDSKPEPPEYESKEIPLGTPARWGKWGSELLRMRLWTGKFSNIK